MTTTERVFISAVLILIAIFVTVDLKSDLSDGVILWHAIIEGSIALIALLGVFFLMKDSFGLKKRLQKQLENYAILEKEAAQWRASAHQYSEGLSKAIDGQLSKWKLSEAEKEVAFLLIKGLSFKEIAEVRKTSEKTARAQSHAVYSKSGLTGRNELAAFFLEDLLVPQSHKDV